MSGMTKAELTKELNRVKKDLTESLAHMGTQYDELENLTEFCDEQIEAKEDIQSEIEALKGDYVAMTQYSSTKEDEVIELEKELQTWKDRAFTQEFLRKNDKENKDIVDAERSAATIRSTKYQRRLSQALEMLEILADKTNHKFMLCPSCTSGVLYSEGDEEYEGLRSATRASRLCPSCLASMKNPWE